LARSGFSKDVKGFSLIEVMCATAIMAVSLVSLAQLFGVATKANRSARNGSVATMLAEQKMEQLRALTWGFDQRGAVVSDTTSNVCVVPETPTGGTGLSLSPTGTLQANTAGYVDYVNEQGAWIGTGATAPAGTVYVRRWSIESLPSAPGNALVLQVLVTHRFSRGAANTGVVSRLPNEARLISVKARRPL
jgi:prepilin-type N-terminal cleavage/methylation domain-containing protein